jgi:hypothetical protein
MSQPSMVHTWKEFINYIPEWERDLLRKSQAISPTLDSVLQNSEASRSLVSNGGAKITRGAYE